MSFNIPDPQKKVDSLTTELEEKYSFGNNSNQLAEIKNIRPIFAFDYLSLSKTKVCFNSKLIDKKKDCLRLLEGLKKISNKTFDDLTSVKSSVS